jgi:hypothetical protein
MTRRELRALREANGGELPADFVFPATAPAAVPVAAAPQASAPTTRLGSALAEFDALAAGREPAAPAADAPPAQPGRRAAVAEPTPATDSLSAFDLLFQPPSAAIPVVPPRAEDQPPVTQPAVTQPPVTQVPVALVEPALPPTAAPAPSPAAPSAAALLMAPPTAAQTPAPVAPVSSTSYLDMPAPITPTPVVPAPSLGHWSTQAELDDAEQVNETTISRTIGTGSGAITTSALVLPSIPQLPIGGAIGDGGEIMLTGSISLPESLSSTGAHPAQLDETDLDHLLDPGDHQVVSDDSTPVRAIRAVSTHTAVGGIVSPTKPKGTRGFTILIIAASVMAVVVVGLLVVGLVSGTL